MPHPMYKSDHTLQYPTPLGGQVFAPNVRIKPHLDHSIPEMAVSDLSQAQNSRNV